MAHKRTDIRNALKALLTGSSPSYATSADANVFANRVDNFPQNKLPSINIIDESETASASDANSAVYTRTLTVKIELRIEANANWDSTLDSFASEVEDLMEANRRLGGLLMGSLYTGTELNFDGSGEKKVGLATLTYEFKYRS